MIQAVIIDSREPEWVQSLTFGGVPTTVMAMDECDIKAVCDDGATILVERKTSDDLLNTLKDDRLFPQMNRLSELHVDQMLHGEKSTCWRPPPNWKRSRKHISSGKKSLDMTSFPKRIWIITNLKNCSRTLSPSPTNISSDASGMKTGTSNSLAN